MMQLYGIPNCDTIKKTLKFLDQKEVAYEFINYREQPLSNELLSKVINAVGLENLINKRSTTFRELSDIEKNNINNDLIQKNPTLIKRPLIVNGSEINVGLRKNFLISL